MIARLKELRQARGMSQQSLADKIGVSQQSINKYENHNVEPDICTLIALAEHFGTSVDYLIGHSTVSHVIEPVTPFDLNAEEQALLQSWRQLDAREKASILSIMEVYTSR